MFMKLNTGWWYTYPSEKYEFVGWDDDIPNWMETTLPNHQAVISKYICWPSLTHKGNMIYSY